jgi:hypothetical protein
MPSVPPRAPMPPNWDPDSSDEEEEHRLRGDSSREDPRRRYEREERVRRDGEGRSRAADPRERRLPNGFRQDPPSSESRPSVQSDFVPPEGSQQIWDKSTQKHYRFPSGFFLDVETGKLCHRPKSSTSSVPLTRPERPYSSSRPKETRNWTTGDPAAKKDYYNPRRRTEDPRATTLPRYGYSAQEAGGGGRQYDEFIRIRTERRQTECPPGCTCETADRARTKPSTHTREPRQRRDSMF